MKTNSHNGLYKWRNLLVLALLCLVPLAASAKIIYRSGETVSLTEDQVVEGDFYATAGTASLSGEVQGDLLTAAGSVTINGSVAEDVFALAGTVQLHASVTDDVRIFAGEATIAESVDGDVLIVALGPIKILSTARIGGDVLLLGSEAEIAGPVKGSVMGVAEQLRIDAPVGGDVDVQVTELVLGERAEVAGDIRYVSVRDLVRAPGAVVEGDVTRTSIADTVSNREVLQSMLIPLFIILFAALTLFLFFREQVTVLATLTRNRFWFKSLLGIALLVGLPILMSLLFATIIGLLVGLVVLFGWLLLIVFSVAMLPIVVGQWLSSLVSKQYTVSVMYIALGALAVELAFFVPLVGMVAILIFLSAIMGTAATVLYRSLN